MLSSNSRSTFSLLAACTLLAFVLNAQTLRAQQPTDNAPRAEAQDDVIDVETRLVRLNVGVADAKGRPITNLTAADFAVSEDGAPQQITSFEPVTTPFSLVVLLDLSGSTLSFRTTLKQAAVRFLDALDPRDRVAVITFNSESRTLVDFTTDRRKIAYAIQVAEGRTPRSEVYGALRYSLQQLARENNRRRAIVVMTDGQDTSLARLDRLRVGGVAATSIEPQPAAKAELTPALASVLDAADRQGVTVYPLALPSGDLKRVRQPTATQVAVYTAARERLETLSNRTGGRLHDIRRLEDMGRLYAEVAADMRTLYTISYQPSANGVARGTWRPIRIGVPSRPELLARTREGYFSR